MSTPGVVTESLNSSNIDRDVEVKANLVTRHE
jgi:hypothetical protein